MNSMSLENFASKIVGDIQESITHEVKRDAELALINAINKTVYEDKKQYTPTYNLLDAVEVSDVKIGNGRATFEIGINATKLIPMPKTPWFWDAHSSISHKPFQEGLVEVLDQGTQTPNPVYEHEPNKFFDKAFEDIEQNLIVTMAKSLRRKGWNVSIY